MFQGMESMYMKYTKKKFFKAAKISTFPSLPSVPMSAGSKIKIGYPIFNRNIFPHPHRMGNAISSPWRKFSPLKIPSQALSTTWAA